MPPQHTEISIRMLLQRTVTCIIYMENWTSRLRWNMFKYEKYRKETSAGGLCWNKCQTARHASCCVNYINLFNPSPYQTGHIHINGGTVEPHYNGELKQL
jgi:hypothetical protein